MLQEGPGFSVFQLPKAACFPWLLAYPLASRLSISYLAPSSVCLSVCHLTPPAPLVLLPPPLPWKDLAVTCADLDDAGWLPYLTILPPTCQVPFVIRSQVLRIRMWASLGTDIVLPTTVIVLLTEWKC